VHHTKESMIGKFSINSQPVLPSHCRVFIILFTRLDTAVTITLVSKLDAITFQTLPPFDAGK